MPFLKHKLILSHDSRLLFIHCGITLDYTICVSFKNEKQCWKVYTFQYHTITQSTIYKWNACIDEYKGKLGMGMYILHSTVDKSLKMCR